MKLDIPVSSLDIFTDFSIAGDVCAALNQVVDDPGFDVYVHYSTSLNPNFEEKENLKVGRICCKPYLNVFLPADKCGQVVMPGRK